MNGKTLVIAGVVTILALVVLSLVRGCSAKTAPAVSTGTAVTDTVK